jgi:acyl transferase domain-containing protein
MWLGLAPFHRCNFRRRQEAWPVQMHGTGTLGDPIEAGAAAAVLFESSRPVALMASKTWSGHAEPAAGMVALAHAQAALRGSQLLPLLHLRCAPTGMPGLDADT